ncbi:Transmembrane emp24 domain-containing protein p24beta3 [Platanthera zijinensis]|uniref:Transmembrane emp24 domain-containing protein p24beta3 n=1 Tax=Platanthera zijinensis TaxID=2320716 RepID=A0AAP0G4L1_9ASPA
MPSEKRCRCANRRPMKKRCRRRRRRIAVMRRQRRFFYPIRQLGGLAKRNIGIPRVSSPTGNTVHSIHGSSGEKFEFKAPRGGLYKFCFRNPNEVPETVSFYIHTGHIPDQHDLAKDDHLNPVNVKIAELREALESVTAEQKYLKAREVRHRRSSSTEVPPHTQKILERFPSLASAELRTPQKALEDQRMRKLENVSSESNSAVLEDYLQPFKSIQVILPFDPTGRVTHESTTRLKGRVLGKTDTRLRGPSK